MNWQRVLDCTCMWAATPVNSEQKNACCTNGTPKHVYRFCVFIMVFSLACLVFGKLFGQNGCVKYPYYSIIYIVSRTCILHIYIYIEYTYIYIVHTHSTHIYIYIVHTYIYSTYIYSTYIHIIHAYIYILYLYIYIDRVYIYTYVFVYI